MEINMQINISELISLCLTFLGLLATIVGGCFALIQWNMSTRLKRAELLNEAITKIRDDPQFAEILSRIDYGEQWYTNDFHSNREMESQYDRVFAYMDYLCYLKKRRILKSKDFRIFEHRMQRIAHNKDSIDYLQFLCYFSKLNNTTMSFPHLLEYLEDKSLLPDNFMDF